MIPWKLGFKDDSTLGALMVDYAHHEIHEGSAFFAIYSATKDNAGTIEVMITTPVGAKAAHMLIMMDAALAATAELWTPTTKTDASNNRITPMNRNANSSKTSILTICHTPGGSQAGTANLVQYIGASATGGRTSASGQTGGRAEFILKSNSTYLLKLTSRANGNALSIILDWYEHSPAL